MGTITSGWHSRAAWPLVAMGLISSMVLAQNASPSSASSSPGDTLEAVIVTAEKTSANLQKVPIAVTAVDGSTLESRGAVAVMDLERITPAVTFTTIDNEAIVFMRGVGQSINQPNADPFVATSFNGAYMPSEITTTAFYDLERVEVLYGPQGTLYGRNAVAGTINMESRRPTFEYGSSLDLELGNFNRIVGTAAVNLPFTDTLAARIAFHRSSHSGYYTNGAEDDDTDSARISVLDKFSDATTIYLTSTYTRIGGIGSEATIWPARPGNPWYLSYDPHDVPLFLNSTSGINTLSMDHSFDDGITLTSVTGYSFLNENLNIILFEGDPVPVSPPHLYNEIDEHSVTQEFRLNGEVGRVKWIGGIYGYHADAGSTALVHIVSQEVVNSTVGPYTQKVDGGSVFGQGVFSITDVLRVTGGIRYSVDKKELDGTNNILPGETLKRPQEFDGDKTWDRPDWKVGADYDLSAASLLYANIATGYNTGGFSVAPVTAGSTEAAVYQPMTVVSYALGSKNRLLNDRLQVNVEAFYGDYKNYQVSARNIITAAQTVYNARKAEVYGMQLDTDYQITARDRWIFSVSATHAVASNLILPVAPYPNYSGFTLPNAPEEGVTTGYDHTFTVAGGSVIADLNYKWEANHWANYTHALGTQVPAFSLVDAAFTYRPNDAKWSLGVWGRNLTNTFTVGLTNPGAIPGPGAGIPLDPRTYGIRLTADF